ncbi:MAG: cobalamin biosynthesis protein [Deferribacteraceae bacterium]|jgi:cobalt-precorrin 5A hydrolase|nr:cobalamin biosynthesis protein [Deferribacteraceae bacterium]
MNRIFILAISKHGAELARAIAHETGAECHIFHTHAVEGETTFDDLRERVKELFPVAQGLIFIMAQGIVSRMIAPYLTSKHTDPAVVACDDAGRFAISAAGGHEGGANLLACIVASITGATPVITTATEANKQYVVGVGARKGETAENIKKAINEACYEAGISTSDVRLIASAWLKQDEEGLVSAVASMGIYIRFVPKFLFDSYNFQGEETAAAKYFDIPAVAEPSALICAQNPELILPAKAYNGVMIAITKDTLCSIS